MDTNRADELRERALADQIKAKIASEAAEAAAQVAPIMAAYYRSLVAEGLPDQFALLMARDFQMSILTAMGLPAKQV